jgi:class 3 adenylate cyclase/tetratricopeptide (TPR) repeat protein
LAGTSQNRTPKGGGSDAEFRHVTVLFTDMVGFTPVAERLGPERAYSLVRKLTSLQAEIIRKCDGLLQDFAGDGVMAVFGAPVASENAPFQACQAALQIQQRMAELQTELVVEFGIAPGLRIGVHSGKVVVGRIGDGHALGYNVIGDVVNVAARVQGAADPGTVFVTDETRKLARNRLLFSSVGSRALKGKSATLELFRLEGLRKGGVRDVSRNSAEPALQERMSELASLEAAASRAAEGRTTAVSIVGDAGLGKSRLLGEFLTANSEWFHQLELSCRSESENSAFAPLIGWLADLVEPAPARSRDQIEKALAAVAPRSRNTAEDIGFLVDLLAGPILDNALATSSAELVGIRSRNALVELLVGLSQSQPLIIAVEDIHWCDTATIGVLRTLLERYPNERILVVATARPSDQARWAGEAADTIPLSPLSNEAALTLARSRLGPGVLESSALEEAVRRAEGNPLFLEETLEYLSSRSTSGDLGEAESAAIPGKLENLFMERVERLGAEVKHYLRVASVIGQEFGPDLVAEILPPDFPSEPTLSAASAAGLVKSVDGMQGLRSFTFKHALLRDALYFSMLSADRATAHEEIGSKLIASNEHRLAEICPVLAYHFSRTQRHAEAIRYLGMAGAKSLRVFSLKEAVSSLDQAIALARKHPNVAPNDIVSQIVIDRLQICCWEADFLDMTQLGQEFLPLVEQQGASRSLSRILTWIGEGHVNAERFDEAEPILNRALSIGEKIQSEECVAYARSDLMFLQLFSPDQVPEEAFVETATQVLNAAERLQDVYLETMACYALSANEIQLGRMQKARSWADRAIELGNRTGYPPARTIGLICHSICDATDGDGGEALRKAEEALATSTGKFERMAAMGSLGLAQLVAGMPRESSITLEAANKIAAEGLSFLLLSVSEVPRCTAKAASGDLFVGIKELHAAIERFTKWRNSRLVAWAHLMLANIYSMALQAEPPALSVLVKQPRLIMLGLKARRLAERHFAEAAQLSRAAGTEVFLIDSLIGLAEMVQKKKPREALAALSEAGEIAARLQNGTKRKLVVERIEALRK